MNARRKPKQQLQVNVTNEVSDELIEDEVIVEAETALSAAPKGDVDRKGRSFMPKVHEHKDGTPILKDGFLVVRDRNARTPLGATLKLNFEREKKRHPGMTFRVVSDVEGRVGAFEERDWIPVDGGTIRQKVGGGVEGILMMKPQEWFDDDQRMKESLIMDSTKKALAVEKGEYVSRDPKDNSPLKKDESYLA